MNQNQEQDDHPATAAPDAVGPDPSTMTPEQEHAFYAEPDHQVPPARLPTGGRAYRHGAARDAASPGLART